jgi:hypothetical protein
MGHDVGVGSGVAMVWLSPASDVMILFKPMPFTLPVKEKGLMAVLLPPQRVTGLVPGRRFIEDHGLRRDRVFVRLKVVSAGAALAAGFFLADSVAVF